ncbi:hypothetical protein PV325_008844 [Microctonus aethiopoides]|nr:hypothetical protein PV325_008844 [Microctonus aethiopoides]
METDNTIENKPQKVTKANITRLPNIEKLEASYMNKLLKEVGIKKTRAITPTPNLNVARRVSQSAQQHDIIDIQGTSQQKDNNEEWTFPKKTCKPAEGRTNIQDNDDSLGNNYDILETNDNMETTYNEEKASTTKKQSCPPIVALHISIKQLITMLGNQNQFKGMYTLRQTSTNTVSISAHNAEIHTLIKEELKNNGIQYYTFTPRINRPKTIILKGIKGGFNEKDVEEELKKSELKNAPHTPTKQKITDRSPTQYKNHSTSQEQKKHHNNQRRQYGLTTTKTR